MTYWGLAGCYDILLIPPHSTLNHWAVCSPTVPKYMMPLIPFNCNYIIKRNIWSSSIRSTKRSYSWYEKLLEWFRKIHECKLKLLVYGGGGRRRENRILRIFPLNIRKQTGSQSRQILGRKYTNSIGAMEICRGKLSSTSKDWPINVQFDVSVYKLLLNIFVIS